MTAAPQTLQDAIITQQKGIGVLSWWVEEMAGYRGTGMQEGGYSLSLHFCTPQAPRVAWPPTKRLEWGEGTKAGKVERKRE